MIIRGLPQKMPRHLRVGRGGGGEGHAMRMSLRGNEKREEGCFILSSARRRLRGERKKEKQNSPLPSPWMEEEIVLRGGKFSHCIFFVPPVE